MNYEKQFQDEMHIKPYNPPVNYVSDYVEWLEKRMDKAEQQLDLLNQLRDSEGSSVTLVCDKPEFDHSCKNNIVIVQAEWTNWKSINYEGDTILECLLLAIKEKDEYMKQNKIKMVTLDEDIKQNKKDESNLFNNIDAKQLNNSSDDINDDFVYPDNIPQKPMTADIAHKHKATFVRKILQPLVELVAAMPSPDYVLDILCIVSGFVADAKAIIRAKQDVSIQSKQTEIDLINLEQRTTTLLNLTREQVLDRYSIVMAAVKEDDVKKEPQQLFSIKVSYEDGQNYWLKSHPTGSELNTHMSYDWLTKLKNNALRLDKATAINTEHQVHSFHNVTATDIYFNGYDDIVAPN